MTLTTEEYYQQLKEMHNGIVCLEPYVKAIVKINHKCSKDHVWLASPISIKRGYGCPTCGKNKPLTTEEYHKRVKNLNKGYICLDEYINARTELIHQCSKGHQWFMAPSKVHTKAARCIECEGRQPNQRLTTEEYHKRVESLNKGFVCIDDYVHSGVNIQHQCSQGHIWLAAPKAIVNGGNGCPICANLKSQYEVYKDKPTWIYYIHIHSLDIYKIGVSMDENGGTKGRYKGSIFEDDYSIIDEVLYNDGWKAFQLEQKIISSNVDRKWFCPPTQKFGGHTECFYECINPSLILEKEQNENS